MHVRERCYKSKKRMTVFLVIFMAYYLYGPEVFAQTFSPQDVEEMGIAIGVIRERKAEMIEDFFRDLFENIDVLRKDTRVRDAILEFNGYVNDDGLSPEKDVIIWDRLYKRLYDKQGEWLSDQSRKYGYWDIFLINQNGLVVWTEAKEEDLGINLDIGIYRTSSLAKLWRNLMDSGGTRIIDFERYDPSGGGPAAFIGGAVVDRNGERLGAVVIQIPIDQINLIMQERDGMGETGEAYLFGRDFLMRSDSIFWTQPSILERKIEAEAARKAVNGESGFLIGPDSRGYNFLFSFQPLNIEGLDWYLMAEIDELELQGKWKEGNILKLHK